MSASCFTQGYYIVSMCSNIIFQILLPYSRYITSHHVTVISHATSSSKIKSKRKTKQNKTKLNKQKGKLLVSKAFCNTLPNLYILAMFKILPCSTFLVLIKSAIHSKNVKMFLTLISKNSICPKMEMG